MTADDCLSCMFDDCAECDTYAAMPELGCCCGHIRAGEDDGDDAYYDDEDWAAQTSELDENEALGDAYRSSRLNSPLGDG
jgi:hypothetical protein